VDSEARGLTAQWTQRALRGASAPIGALCLAVRTAAAASAQLADRSINPIVDSPDPGAAGATATCTVTVIKNGPGTATHVAATTIPPPNTQGFLLGCPAGWSTNTGPIFTCLVPPPADGNVGLIHCQIASLGSGFSATFTITVQTGPEPGAAADRAGGSSGVLILLWDGGRLRPAPTGPGAAQHGPGGHPDA
jgi:hypothetical protein